MLIAEPKYISRLPPRSMIPISGEPAKIRIRIAGEQNQTAGEVESQRGLIIQMAELKFPNPTPTVTSAIRVTLISGQPEECQVRTDRYLKLQARS